MAGTLQLQQAAGLRDLLELPTVDDALDGVCDLDCQARELAALQRLYQQLNGSSWALKRWTKGWMDLSTHHCNWDGVFCCKTVELSSTNTSAADSQPTFLAAQSKFRLSCNMRIDSDPTLAGATVVGLVLNNHGLRGALDWDVLADLVNLQGIDMSDNQITACLPMSGDKSLGLDSLHDVFLGRNQISGPLPEWMALVGIVHFDLSSNSISGTVPDVYTKMTSLEILQLAHNHLTGTFPAGLVFLPSMESINLAFNQLSGSLAAAPVTPGISLNSLNLGHNELTGSIPGYFEYISFQYLDLSHNHFTGTIPCNLGNKEYLVSLQVDTNSFSGSLDFLKDMSSLQTVMLHTNNFSGSIHYELPASLLVFDLFGNANITGPLPDNASMVDLTSMNLVDTGLRGPLVNGSFQLPSYLTLVDGFDYVIIKRRIRCTSVQIIDNPQANVQLSPMYYGFQRCRCILEGSNAQFVRGPEGEILDMWCEPVLPEQSGGIQWYVILAIVAGVALILAALITTLWIKLGANFIAQRDLLAKNKPPGTSKKCKEVTLVLTDVEGSTELWEWDTEITSIAIDIHDRLLRANMSRFFGYEVMTEGDAFLVSFHEPCDAVAWCMSTQLALLNAPWPHDLLEHPMACVQTVRDIELSQLATSAARFGASPASFCHSTHQNSTFAWDLGQSQGGSDRNGGSDLAFHQASDDHSVIKAAMTSGSIAKETPGSNVSASPRVHDWDHYTKQGIIFRGLRVRMAMATGLIHDVQIHKITHRVEYYGDVTNRAQALSDLPSGGQVLIDQESFKGINGQLNQLGACLQSSLQGASSTPRQRANRSAMAPNSLSLRRIAGANASNGPPSPGPRSNLMVDKMRDGEVESTAQAGSSVMAMWRRMSNVEQFGECMSG